MPGATALVAKSSMATLRLDWLEAKVKLSGLKTGSFISPAAGAAVPATGMMLSAGSGASSSPTSWSSTEPVNASFRDTLKVGPSVGDDVVDGRVICDGGVM